MNKSKNKLKYPMTLMGYGFFVAGSVGLMEKVMIFNKDYYIFSIALGLVLMVYFEYWTKEVKNE